MNAASPLSRLPGTAAALLAAVALAGCVADQPLASAAQMAPPSLSVSAACEDSLGGLTHTESTITAPVTWARSDNPHRVNGELAVLGAGRLHLAAGVRVCFGPNGLVRADSGGRIRAAGLDTAAVVLMARAPQNGWKGIVLDGAPDSASVFRNVRIQHVGGSHAALASYASHALTADSVVVRQSARAFHLGARGSRVSRTRVDTTTHAALAAVRMVADSTHVEQLVVRAAAGVGLEVAGAAGMSVLGVRIEDAGGIGLVANTVHRAIPSALPVRVVGGATYGARLSAPAMAKLYPALADQDSLLGNARDTLLMSGGTLKGWAFARHVLPWRVEADIVVDSAGILRGQAWSTFVFEPGTGITAQAGGRVLARGTKTAPVLLTALHPDSGWDGIYLDGAPDEPSKFTNLTIEHVRSNAVAVHATDDHPVLVDSAVLRQNGVAAWLVAAGSSIRRSRVDTTTSLYPAVGLGGNTAIESTRIRGSNGHGLIVGLPTAQVISCDVRGSAGHGVYLVNGGTVRDCNVQDNGGDGLHNQSTTTADAEDLWWGDSDGPTGTNGDGVSGPVDYTPWRTAPFVLPYVP